MFRSDGDVPRVSRRRLLTGVGVGVSGVSVWGLAPLFRSDGLPNDPPKIFGHRGAEGLAPPNTLAAIRAGLDSGVDGIELDVWRTADDELILFHDAVLDWDSTGQGWIENQPWDEIRGATIDGEPIIHLRDALEVIAPTGVELYVELKGDGTATPVLEYAEEYGVLDRLTAISFADYRLVPARDAGVPTALIASMPTSNLASDATEFGADAAMSHYVPRMTENFLDEAREQGLTAGIWKLVETKQTLRDSLEVGPDVLVTNFPDEAIELLAGR